MRQSSHYDHSAATAPSAQVMTIDLSFSTSSPRLVNPLGEEYLNEMYLSFVPLFEALTTGHDLDVVTEELAFIDERWF